MAIQHADVTSIHRFAYVSASDPGAVGQYKAWVDTSVTPHRLKMRNAANTAWLDIGHGGDNLQAIATATATEGAMFQFSGGTLQKRTVAQVKAALSLDAVPNMDTRARGTHTGTQVAATISDFTTAVDTALAASEKVIEFTYNGLSIQSQTGVGKLNFLVPENLGANRNLTLIVNNTSRSLTIAADATISGVNTGDRVHAPLTATTISEGSITPDVYLYDLFAVTALAENLSINLPTSSGGLVSHGKKLTIRITAVGATRTLTWDAYVQIAEFPLPTTLDAGKTLYVDVEYNKTVDTWVVRNVSTTV